MQWIAPAEKDAATLVLLLAINAVMFAVELAVR